MKRVLRAGGGLPALPCPWCLGVSAVCNLDRVALSWLPSSYQRIFVIVTLQAEYMYALKLLKHQSSIPAVSSQ